MNAFYDRLTVTVDVLVRAILGVRAQPRHTGAPARRVADVAADVGEQRDRVHAVAIAARAGKRVAVAGFRAEFDEQIRRREPLELQAVLRELSAEEGLIRERLIDEVPRVRVDLVEIADAGEVATALEQRAPRAARAS